VFPVEGCTLEDLHEGFLHYRLNRDKVTWAQMFTLMEATKEKFKVEAYSVGQTSLEQVFLNFTKVQVNSED
jgi:ATP-binding cassette subfamily A (ABC1) protein 3